MENTLGLPGFGYFPETVIELLENLTRTRVENIYGYEPYNLTKDTYDGFMCDALISSWTLLFPDLMQSDKSVCPPEWNGASCFPPTQEFSLAVFPCMTVFNQQFYNTNDNASRECGAGGEWNNKTDYSQCNVIFRSPDELLDLSVYIYTTGYIFSIVALLTTISIYICFRELRCLRHKIHIGLFLAVALTDITWCTTISLQNLIRTDYYESVINVLCATQIATHNDPVLNYFHLTTFFWMFLEGLYLFLQVQLPLSLAMVRHLHFLLIGWGVPLLMMLVWVVIRVMLAREEMGQGQQTQIDQVAMLDAVLSCPFMSEHEIDFYAYKLPIMGLLAANTFFLVWIMVIVISKLRSQIPTMDHDRKHFKAAKALTVIIPLFGLNYFLTLLGPDREQSHLAHLIFQLGRSVLISVQGAVITLPYCFCNTEVRAVLKLHWNRWKLVRTVGTEYQSTLTNSLAPSSRHSNQENHHMLALYKAEAESLLSPKRLPTSTELVRTENLEQKEE